jgi:hypothetical protein
MVMLADGRRGLAAGLAIMSAAFAALVWSGGQPVGAIALLAGGLVAAGLRFFRGPAGWGLMEPGSTPRIILTVVAGMLALWIAASIATGPGAPLRFAVLSTLGLLGERMLQEADRDVVLCAAAGLALALAAAAGLAGGAAGIAPYVIAAVIAGGVSVLSVADARGT